jgi:hypothetical protein
MRILICKIPPDLPFPKGGTIPLFGKEKGPQKIADFLGY